jgi:hypothetical protein
MPGGRGSAFELDRRPEIVCRCGNGGELTADPKHATWAECLPQLLRENVTEDAPLQETRVSVAWHRTELRVLFVCTDSRPWATITQRDGALWEEEVVEVFIDPVGDGASYFEFEVNPLNTVLDLVMRRVRSGYRRDFAWDCEGLQTAVLTTSIGWNAAFAIPFAAIAADAPQSGSVWRVNFFRIDRPSGRPRELSAWSPTRLATFHAPERFGVLRFE